MNDARHFLLAIAAASFFAAPSAYAQDRPSLSRLEEYACVAANDRGDSYRPIFCEGRCDCLDGEDLSGATSCTQGMNGAISIEGAILGDAECLGTCTDGLALCYSNSECPGFGNECVFSPPIYPDGTCVVPSSIGCTDDSECDQASGFTCLTITLGSLCASASCSVEGICDTGVILSTFTRTIGFAPLGDATPVACDAGGNISSTDVAECIAQVEAHLGAGACLICGDGNLDAGEQCDDGNLDAGDGCATDCTTE